MTLIGWEAKDELQDDDRPIVFRCGLNLLRRSVPHREIERIQALEVRARMSRNSSLSAWLILALRNF